MRHLIWDNAVGLELELAYKLGWSVVIGSVVMTALTVAVV
jgi:succinate dehydrogenase / fumarate reductase, cytochrome b subunit